MLGLRIRLADPLSLLYILFASFLGFFRRNLSPQEVSGRPNRSTMRERKASILVGVFLLAPEQFLISFLLVELSWDIILSERA